MLPVILILLYGYGVTFDVKHVPVAIVMEAPSPDAAELAAGFSLSPYFDVRAVTSDGPGAGADAGAQGRRRRLHPRGLRAPEPAGRGARCRWSCTAPTPTGRASCRAYAAGRAGRRPPRAPERRGSGRPGRSMSQSRLWFNDANDSHYFLVPGLIVLVMTLIGATLTAMVMSREWERGTLEALFVTPVQADEILIGKIVPYFLLGLVGLALCVLAARFLFDVPLRGSLWVLA